MSEPNVTNNNSIDSMLSVGDKIIFNKNNKEVTNPNNVKNNKEKVTNPNNVKNNNEKKK